MLEGDAHIREEQVRIRDRLHRIEGSLATIELREKALDNRLHTVEEDVSEIIEEDKIAAAVAERINRQRHVVLNATQKVLLTLAALTPVGTFVILLVRQVGVG